MLLVKDRATVHEAINEKPNSSTYIRGLIHVMEKLLASTNALSIIYSILQEKQLVPSFKSK